MKRTAKDKRDLPHPAPVERIELNEEHTTRRLVLAIVFLAVGAVLLVYAVSQLFTPQSDWVTIEGSSGEGASSASEFVFLYHLGKDGISARTEQRAVTLLYRQLCRDAFEVFHNQLEVEGVNNLYAINRHPNEELTVDGALYEAFEAVERSGSRMLYLGPVYDRYESIFNCQDDSQLVDFDPRLSEEVRQEYLGYAGFANDPQAVRVELLGENRVRLFVSQAYLDYAAREGIESFIDFSWTRNAFIADYLAGELAAQGYGRGALTSYDGFVRCMDESGEEYSLQLYDRQGQNIYGAAVMRYQGPMSIVSLRDYPVNELDAGRFYQLRSGEMRTPYLDPADGLCKSAVSGLVCYAGDKGCGEILLEMAPIYIADVFQKDELTRLAAEGIASIYCKDGVIYPSDPHLTLAQIYDNRYTVAG